MQGVKGAWRKFLGFLEGGTDDDEWEDDQNYNRDYSREYDKDYDDYDRDTQSRDYYEYDSPQSYDDGLDFAGLERRDRGRAKKGNNVLEFDAGRVAENQITVRISRPKEMQDATLICEYLQDKMVCIVDMQGVDHIIAQRIADYLGGVAYALRGHVERIDNYIFVMAPEGTKIDSDLREGLKSGLFKFGK